MAFGLSAGAVSLIGAGAGLIGSSMGGGDSTQQATQSKAPWEPAQPFLLKDLQTNQDLQNWYTKNPFNQQQKVGLQNTMTDADNFRTNIMPGLLNFSNESMSSNYQRQTGGAPGSGGGYGGAVRPGGLLQSGPGAFSMPTPSAPSAPSAAGGGLMGGAMGGFMGDIVGQINSAFAPKPVGNTFGQIDWQGQNPFTNGYADKLAEQRKIEAEIEAKRLAELQAQKAIMRQIYGDSGGDGSDGGDSGDSGDSGDGSGEA